MCTEKRVLYPRNLVDECPRKESEVANTPRHATGALWSRATDSICYKGDLELCFLMFDVTAVLCTVHYPLLVSRNTLKRTTIQSLFKCCRCLGFSFVSCYRSSET